MNKKKQSLKGWVSPNCDLIWSREDYAMIPVICRKKPTKEFYRKTLPILYIKCKITVEEI